MESEEWMLESIKLYKDLHDFALQEATRVIAWPGDQSICVAGYSGRRSHEILQLLFPQKLHETENQALRLFFTLDDLPFRSLGKRPPISCRGLCPERDLKVEYGGFSEHPVYSLQPVPGTRLLLTSGPSAPRVQIWQIGAEDKDVIQPTASIQSDPSKDTWTKIAVSVVAAPRVVHGSQVSGVHITEIESARRVYTLAVSSGEAVGSLVFLDPSTVHLCCLSGRQLVADVRRPGIASEGSAALEVPGGGQWCAAVKPESRDSCAKIASLSSEGHIAITDTRDLGAPLKCGRARPSRGPDLAEELMSVCWAPRLEECVSISGFDGTVQIYDTRRWDAAAKEVDALFTHRGHSAMGECEDGSPPRVSAHSWHPWKERTLVSAANDGSLHIWDWLDGAT